MRHRQILLQAMGMMNKQLNMPALQKIMREFERQNERMEMTSEMMGDAIDDAFEVRVCNARMIMILYRPFCKWKIYLESINSSSSLFT